jgi:hypothetical protein
MSCSCGCRQSEDDTRRKYDELLEHAGLREIVEQGRDAFSAASTALEQLVRAERAEILGFGDGVAEMHRDSATRHNRRARQQLGFLIQRIDARLEAKDWASIVKEAEAGFLEHGGREHLEDARAEIRMNLLEQEPGLTAAVSEQALALFDRAAARAKNGNLTSVLELMRENCEVALEGFASDQMGRQPAAQGLYLSEGEPPPISGGQNVNGWCVALGACLAWAYSSLIASLIICFAVIFCWCCFHLAVLGTFAIHQLACFLAFQPACASG